MTLSLEQRLARKYRVGASEVAALLTPSAHPWVTPQAIYDRIINGVEPETNHAMVIGQLAEPHVLAMARDYYRLRAVACTRSYVHPRLPVAASPDAYIRDGQGLVEIKTTSSNWVDQPPEHVVVQVQCQLWLAHRSYAHVVVWQGSQLRLFTLEADGLVASSIEGAVRRFTEDHLRPHIPPIAVPVSRDFHMEAITP